MNGPIKDQNIWRIRNNDELQVMYRKANTVTTTKARRLEYVGHVVKMSDDRTVRKVLLGKTGERRRAGNSKYE